MVRAVVYAGVSHIPSRCHLRKWILIRKFGFLQRLAWFDKLLSREKHSLVRSEVASWKERLSRRNHNNGHLGERD
jgi:hypothetical protein